MYSIGDMVFYPVFGAGLIINIEEKEIYNEIKKYYLINFIDGMNMMIPVYSNDIKKLRKAVSREECAQIFEILKSKPENLPLKWSERNRYYSQCLNEGEPVKLSKIIRDISALSKSKKLSKSETKIFMQILDLTSGEISLVTGRNIEDIKREILEMLGVKGV